MTSESPSFGKTDEGLSDFKGAMMMRIIEMRTLEIVCRNLPRIADALERMANMMERQVNTDSKNTDKTVEEV